MRFIKKKKEQKRKAIKEKKEVRPDVARKLVLLVVFVLVLSGPVGFFAGRSASRNVREAKEEIKQLKKKSSMYKGGEESLSPLYQRYIESFLDVYLNISNSQNEYDSRTKSLKEFCSYGIEDIPNSNVIQTLKSRSFYDLEKNSSYWIAKYLVTYEVQSPVEKERKVKKDDKEVTEKYVDYETKTSQKLINVPFSVFDKTYKVVAMPYFSVIQNLKKGNVEAQEKESKSLEVVNGTQGDKVNAFVKKFLESYASGEKSQISYMMDNAEVSDGSFSISNVSSEIYKKSDKIFAYVTIDFKENATKIIHQEQMSLRIIKKESNFYVEKLTHQIGGIVND